MRKTDASIEKWSWIKDCFLGFGLHFEEDAKEDLGFFASGRVKRGFFAGGPKVNASVRDLFGMGDEGGVEDGEEVGGSGAGSSGGGEDEEIVDLFLLL